DASRPTLPLPGSDQRLIGWRPDGDLVFTTTQPRPGHPRHTSVVLVHPDGTWRTVLDPPADVQAIDIPRQLAEHGQLGGASSHPHRGPPPAVSSLPPTPPPPPAIPWRRPPGRPPPHRPPPPRRPSRLTR